MPENTIKKDSYVLIYLKRGKTWLIKAGGSKLHTHVGYLNLDDLVGKKYGETIKTSLDEEMSILEPTTQDFIAKSHRGTQIIYPKDAGLITTKMNVHSGTKVVEVGTGSGAFTTHLANLVRPDGHVYSYDIREDCIKLAEGNLRRAGLSEFVTLTMMDAKDEINIRDADAAMIDVGDPWSVVETVWKTLKGGGLLSSLSPTMNQVEKITIKLEESGFTDIESVELLLRNIEARYGKTRPAMRMIGHTAYLTFARKIIHNIKS